MKILSNKKYADLQNEVWEAKRMMQKAMKETTEWKAAANAANKVAKKFETHYREEKEMRISAQNEVARFRAHVEDMASAAVVANPTKPAKKNVSRKKKAE
jgi:uncharacterized coiled-coil DUF342 family protein